MIDLDLADLECVRGRGPGPQLPTCGARARRFAIVAERGAPSAGKHVWECAC